MRISKALRITGRKYRKATRGCAEVLNASMVSILWSCYPRAEIDKSFFVWLGKASDEILLGLTSKGGLNNLFLAKGQCDNRINVQALYCACC